MPNSIERVLQAALAAPFYFGQILIQKTATGGFVLSHRDDEGRNDLQTFRSTEDAIDIAKYDDAGNYRPLKTAPNLRRGWRLEITISDPQIDDLVANFCRSNGGCLRTILWERDARGTVSSTKLPKEKFDPAYDQATTGPLSTTAATTTTPATVPLLCQEACSLLIAECRKVMKGE